MEEVAKYFIIDSKDKNSGIDYEEYWYESNRNNKLKEGCFVIYRKPVNSKGIGFYFYGMGKIEKIIRNSNPKNEYFCIAKITDGIPFKQYIYNYDLEDFCWTFREKKDTWHNFFNQYGITEINEFDFTNLYELVLRLSRYDNVFMDNMDKLKIEKNTFDGLNSFELYKIDFESNKKTKKGKNLRKIDYEVLAKKNIATGKQGELIVLEYEKELLKMNKISKEVKHVSLEDDTLGYDILSYDEEFKEKYIEVKTSRYGSGIFYFTENELHKSKNLKNYWIYYVDLSRNGNQISMKQITDNKGKVITDLKKYLSIINTYIFGIK